jgi:hypothetical protein
VYRDALAPVQDKPLPKPWERAPVSAHAPRLQGRQIWKKAGIRKEANIENDPSQVELEAEGRGARKRLRAAGGKENIADALWLTNPGKPLHDEQDNSEEVESGLGGREKDALSFVPRKRTNTDHVITPKKPLRQATLNGQAQTLALTQVMEGTIEKPVRRRKSLRKSMRKSEALMNSEPVSAPVTTNPEMAQIVESDGRNAVDVHERKDEEQSSAASTNSKDLGISSEASQTATEASSTIPSQHPIEEEISVAQEAYIERQPLNAGEEQSVDDHRLAASTVRIPFNDLEDQSERSSSATDLEPPTTPVEMVKVDEKPQVCAQSLGSAALVLPSIENDLDVDSGRHLKSTGTPKKGKGQGMRRGTRRRAADSDSHDNSSS